MEILIHRISFLSLVGIFVFTQFGCSHTGPILSESTQEKMGRIGVVVKAEEEESLQDSRRGWLSSIGQGAGRGSAVPVGGAVICGPMFIVCLPF